MDESTNPYREKPLQHSQGRTFREFGIVLLITLLTIYVLR
jgi:hypothetical protein